MRKCQIKECINNMESHHGYEYCSFEFFNLSQFKCNNLLILKCAKSKFSNSRWLLSTIYSAAIYIFSCPLSPVDVRQDDRSHAGNVGICEIPDQLLEDPDGALDSELVICPHCLHQDVKQAGPGVRPVPVGNT